MKRFLLATIGMSLLLTGCFHEEPRPSAVDYARLESNQKHHYRPIHQRNSSWSAQRLGKTLTVRTGESTIKLSVRHDPDQVLMRQGGVIVGSVHKTGSGIQIVPAEASGVLPTSLNCMDSKTLVLTHNGTIIRYKLAESAASGSQFSVREDKETRRITLCNVDANHADSDLCQGVELDSPFSVSGTLVFHEDRIPLVSRAALAWYLTVFDLGFCSQ